MTWQSLLKTVLYFGGSAEIECGDFLKFSKKTSCWKLGAGANCGDFQWLIATLMAHKHPPLSFFTTSYAMV
jgi:hypothetical protein